MMRCQQKCDQGSQCTRIADHNDGYHLTEHGCVCLTDDKRNEINEWFTHVAPPDPFTEWSTGLAVDDLSDEQIQRLEEVERRAVPPAHPGIVSSSPVSTQEDCQTFCSHGERCTKARIHGDSHSFVDGCYSCMACGHERSSRREE